MKNKKYIINSVIVGLIVLISSSITAYATSYLYNAGDVSYDNTNSGLTSNNVQSAMEELYAEATNYSDMKKMIYPVGSIYLSVTDDTIEKVQERFGGTWEVFGAGRTLVGFNSSEIEFNEVQKTGGEKTHTLTLAEAPAHTHTRGTMNISGTLRINSDSGNAGVDAPGAGTGAIGAVNGTGCGSSGGGCGWNVWSGFNFNAASNWTGNTSSAGGNGAHNNLQPYITVYMYKRVA